MPVIDIQKEFGADIDKLWDNPKSPESKKAGYAVPARVEQEALLFIGINPSLRDKDKQTKGKRFFYHLDEKKSSDKIDPYFKKMAVLAEKNSMAFAHIDLLFVREKSQKVVEKMWKEQKDKQFFDAQLAISKRMIVRAKPRIIVVSNAFAGKLLLEEKFFECLFDARLGTHKTLQSEALGDTPVFFTSMLSGQRALDNGSFDRLSWHIGFVNRASSSRSA
jgi:hypothetical protein